MRTQMIGALGIFAIALALAGPASAASSVDVTYDLADTIVLHPTLPDCPAGTGICLSQTLLDSSMKIRYASNSASSMPILSGAATLQSLTLSWDITINWMTGATNATLSPITTGHIRVNLLSPITGSVLSGGTLTFGAGQFGVTGSRHCGGIPVVSAFCVAAGATLTSVVGVLPGPVTTAATPGLAGSLGPYGGAQSTGHTVSGSLPLSVPTKLGGGTASVFFTGISVVGREILREAEGHPPKPIPEPGTLLLLGAGTAGLALVGRATRRSPQS